MSDGKKLPIPADPVAAYRKGVAERAAVMRQKRAEERGPLPDLGLANQVFDPRKQPPSTLADMARAQKALEDPQPQAGGLSPDTVKGLQDLHAEVQRRQQGAPQAPPPPQQQPQQPQPLAPPPEGGDDDTPSKATRDKAVRAKLRDMDGYEIDRMMDNIRQDVINNETEKKAVEERLAKEGSVISIEDGLATGEFKQTVPIAQGLRVTYRSVSPMENQALRCLLWKWCDEKPLLEGIAGDIYGMMLLVASVHQINSTQLPSHLTGPDIYTAELDEDMFARKFNRLNRYPAPLIHAVGVHGNWFDERVRKAFTSEALKNG